MLHINNACIAFGTEVLFSGFNMKLERGETACIVGQSGCGKTSLLMGNVERQVINVLTTGAKSKDNPLS